MLTATQSAIIRKTAQGAFYKGLELPSMRARMADFVTVFNTSGKNLEVGWFGQPPAVREHDGQVAYSNLNAYTDTITPKEWDCGVAFKEDTFEDDATGTAALAGTQLVAKCRDHFNVRATAFIEAGIAGSLDTAFDGQFFFDGDHYGVTDAAHDNDLASITAASGTDPTPAELEPGCGDILEAMAGFVDDQNYPWPYDPSRIVFMGPTEYERSMNVVLGPNGSLGGAPGAGEMAVYNQDSAVTGRIRKPWFVNPYLANADSIYALAKPGNGSVGPLVLNLRRDWEFKQFDASNDSVCAEQRLVKFMAYARYEFGYGVWQDACVNLVA